MSRSSRLILAVAIASVAVVPTVAAPAIADPVKGHNTLSLTADCSGGRTFTFLISPASGAAVLDTHSTAVQVTFALTVNDPLNELGGSFSIPLKAGIPRDKLISCNGTVIGTQAVTYSALVLLTPARH